MTSKQRVLAELWDGKPVPSWTLNEKAKTADYRSRISEMRRAGLNIVSLTIDKRHYYRLLTPTRLIDFKKCTVKADPRQIRYDKNLSLFMNFIFAFAMVGAIWHIIIPGIKYMIGAWL